MGLGLTGKDDIASDLDTETAGTSAGEFLPQLKPMLALPALLKRPLLVGGLGLSATLALLGSTHINPLDSSTLLSAIALGSGLWWWRRGVPAPAAPKPIAPPVVDRSRVEIELATLLALIDTLAREAESAGQVAQVSAPLTTYRQEHQALGAELDRQTLRVAIAGEPRAGKTTLLTLLTPPADAAVEKDAALSFEEMTLTATPDWLNYDGLLLITDGDITDSALTLLRERAIAGQGAVLVFNKHDHYDAADQQTILTQLQQRVATLPATVPVVTAAAAPRPIKVRRHQADGTFTETMETPAPAIAGLQAALDRALVAERSTLVAATVLRRSQALRQQVQTDLNRLRRDRALPLIDQLQWVAGAAAFANPVPTLDLLATVAINGQLILDLGKIYGFNLTLNEAKTAAGTLASLTVKLGLVELSTQVLTAVLKSHFATYLAGGLVQGLSAAYLTRMAGLSLVDYFEQAALAGTPTSELSWEAIAQRLQTTVQQNRQLSLLQTLAKQGIDILKPTPAQLPASTAPLDLEPIALDPIAETIPAIAIPLESTPPNS
ncbi:YcjF family protein [Nodosilinea sp. FACHB-131]|uniref:YcjF family protein n=1 Tax=Cyanophyceae TaxID=3028117 RepID=UPI0016885F78|nr:YcjF family protein [Nodosilinea sp. FACHB-131]MBD1875967.1 YcjF family protein [Nodosilinea sp. FACHB-131]